MSAANVLRHPAFERAPISNPKTRGRPKGTVSFRMAQRRNVLKNAPPKGGKFMEVLLSLGLSESELRRLYDAIREDSARHSRPADEPAGQTDD
jgi:hypothetical protein